MTRAPIGHRIRRRREELGLTQARLAQRGGISASYLNLIEHDRRTPGGGLLRRLAEALELDPQALSGAEESRLVGELAEAAADPALAETGFDAREAERLVAAAPQSARALLALYRAHRDLAGQVADLSERMDRDPFLADASHQILTLITAIRSFSEILRDYEDLEAAQRQRFLAGMVSESEKLTQVAQEMFDFLGGQAAASRLPSPEAEVDDLIADNRNHFPPLETAAEDLRRWLRPQDGLQAAALLEALRQRQGIAVGFAPPETLPPEGQVFDANRRRLTLSEAVTAPGTRFRLAELVASLEAPEAVDDIVAGARLSSEAAREAARRALMRYLASAILFPYEPFLDAAQGLRYDIERLQQRFGGSFEQVCHRLTTLRRDGREGIPFHFLRSDIAGNLSKRFSASGLRLPRHSGACPRWVLHEAFLTPGRIVTQRAEMPDGASYIFVAQAVAKPGGGHGRPRSRYAVMIGCDAAYARHLVYGDHLEGASGTPVGTSCRLCPREDCGQRAAPRAAPAGASDGEGPGR